MKFHCYTYHNIWIRTQRSRKSLFEVKRKLLKYSICFYNGVNNQKLIFNKIIYLFLSYNEKDTSHFNDVTPISITLPPFQHFSTIYLLLNSCFHTVPVCSINVYTHKNNYYLLLLSLTYFLVYYIKMLNQQLQK